MRKYLLPSALILVLGLGFAIAQSITKSVQLSQDPLGPIGYDTQGNVYFPAHILTTNTTNGAPTVHNDGPGTTAATLDANATDFSGTLTGGGVNNTTNQIIFSKAYLVAPHCVVMSQNVATSPLAYNTVATGINITTAMGAAVAHYVCSGAK